MHFEKTVSILAIIISMVAITVSIWQGVETRDHNKLSLAPYLQATPTLGGDKRDGIYLSNDGTGTAFIKNATISVKNHKYDLTSNNWYKIYDDLNLTKGCFSESWLPIDSTLKAAEEISLISITRADKPECYLQVLKLVTAEGLRLSIEYTSVYKEVYVYSKVVSIRIKDQGS
ncbi:MAG: hypothetical protein JKY04_03335 [Sneathiella sp.]|nr:hypothetical protein [Sneathiella sp.]MBL4898731.1 hypothetical protein [Colwellia sp.]